LKSDGFPTYHLAVVVDDHVMGITHIFRGEDWLPSTPKHLLIYRAFGWNVPPMAHFPNVLGPDSKKLAKRHGATRVEQFRADGYLPEAMVNYLALIGWAPGTEDEVFSTDDLIARWRIDQVQKAGGKWDRDRLNWFNGVWIRKLTLEALMERLAPYVPAEWDRGVLAKALPLVRERMQTLVEARDQLAFFFTDGVSANPALLVQENDRARSIRALARGAQALRALGTFDAVSVKAAIEGVAAELGWKVKPVTLVIRAAVTGRKVGPPLYESLELLGKERSIARRAQAAGLESVWFHDSYFERDAVTYATAVASQVDGIKVGLGALNPFTRHPVLVAMTISALDEMAPERILLGLGSALPLRLGQMGVPYDPAEAATRVATAIDTL